MRSQYTQTVLCTFCRRLIDLPSGFWFELDAARVAHPDCMSYVLERGAVPAGSTLTHTCGEPRCVKPDHLILNLPEGQ